MYIHGHGEKSFPAFETYGNLNEFYKGDLIWTYIPLTAEDKINEICVRRYSRTESALTITVGLQIPFAGSN